MEKQPPASDCNLLTKLYRREIHGTIQCHRKARPQRLFKKIPKRLCYRLSSLVPASVLEEGHVFLGFTKCGQFVVSYTCQMDANEQTALPFYTYKLQWWWFVPNKPLQKVSEVSLFEEEDILQDLYILFCEWPQERSQVFVFGHSFPARNQESCQCYFTITTVPPLTPCKACDDLQTSPEDKTRCLKHSFCFHSKYELTPPFPVFSPRIQLNCDGKVILNTGDSIVALHVDLDQTDSKPKGPFGDMAAASVLKMKDNSNNDKSKDLFCCSPEMNREFIWTNASSASSAVSGALGSDGLFSEVAASYGCGPLGRTEMTEVSPEVCCEDVDSESQKENSASNANSAAALDVRIVDKIRSPRSPKCILSQNQKSPTHPVSPADKWLECRNITYPTSPSPSQSLSMSNQSNVRRGVRAGSSSADTFAHSAKDLYNFDSDDSEDNSYSFMCPNVPKTSLRPRPVSGQDILSHQQGLMLSPSFHMQRQLSLALNKSSPLMGSSALNCLTGSENGAARNLEPLLAGKNYPAIQRSFFSPSNSENSFGGTSSSADSVIVQINDARTVTHSWRKFSYHGDTEVDSTLVIEDDFDLTYRSVLPAAVRGTKNRPLALSLDPSNDANKEQIYVKQLTFDIEHYMEEAIRDKAKWGERYIAFTNYDLQILDVFSDRNEALAKVYALITAREDTGHRKIRKSKAQEKLYQTSFTFEINFQSGAYETLLIEDLTLIDEKDVRSKEWKPGFRECSTLRRQMYIPQSAKCVHVLSNESVFKGKSLQILLYPEQYIAIIL